MASTSCKLVLDMTRGGTSSQEERQPSCMHLVIVAHRKSALSQTLAVCESIPAQALQLHAFVLASLSVPHVRRRRQQQGHCLRWGMRCSTLSLSLSLDLSLSLSLSCRMLLVAGTGWTFPRDPSCWGLNRKPMRHLRHCVRNSPQRFRRRPSKMEPLPRRGRRASRYFQAKLVIFLLGGGRRRGEAAGP